MKTAIIVGASSGIGRATAAELMQNGYEVFNISRSPCKMSGVVNCLADVTDEVMFEHALKKVMKKCQGKIDIALYSAGYSLMSPTEFVDIEGCRYMFDVNYFGAVRFVKHLLPSMLDNKSGKIFLVGSLVSRLPIPYFSFYASTKAALERFAEGLSQEIKPHGLHCTLVMPGGTRTNFTERRDIISVAETSYENTYWSAVEKVSFSEINGMSAAKAAEIIMQAITKNSPPLLLPLGATNALTCRIAKVLPASVLGKIMKLKFEGI